MVAEYIEREALLAQITEAQVSLESDNDAVWELNKKYFKGLAWAHRLVLDTPAADVAPVVHGHWEPVLECVWNLPTPVCVGWRCSVCGRDEQNKEPYCNCGARMDGEG